jgi:hypothetical protein
MSETCEFDHWEDDATNEGMDIESPWGCLFPGECCMPGFHHESECRTAQDMEDILKQQHVEDFAAWWSLSGLDSKVEKSAALAVWLAARGEF